MAILLGILLVADLGYSVYNLQAAKSLRPWNLQTRYSYRSELPPVQHLLVVGDSIAAGLGASSQSHAMFDRLGRHFSQDQGVVLENRAVSGYRVNDLLKTPRSRDQYDKVVIIIGSNDVFHFTNLDEFERQISELTAQYAQLAPQVVLVGPGRVFTTSGTPVLSKPFFYRHAKKVGAMMRQATDAFPNVSYVNPHDPLPLRDYGNTEASDHFHPNDVGHEYWFDMVMLGFQQLEANRPRSPAGKSSIPAE